MIDGDTVVADIDLGFSTWRHGERLRLYGIDAPEVRGETREEGRRAAEALRDLVEGKPVLICTIEDCTDSFGRYLVRILDGRVPEDLDVHIIMDNLAIDKDRAAKAWLARRPRSHVHFRPARGHR